MSALPLFEPDLFSRSRPVFVEVEPERKRSLAESFQTLFGDASDEVLSVQQAGGLEINSSNFALHTHQGVFLLKVHRDLSEESCAILERQCTLMEWLMSQGQPVPRPVRG